MRHGCGYSCSGYVPSRRRSDRIISPKEVVVFEVLKGHTDSCQRRTCLKLDRCGDLSALDRQNLMQLLCQVDRQACLDDVDPVVGSGAGLDND